MLTTSEPSSDTCTEWLLWAVNCYATATIILDGLDMLEHQALQRLMATLAYTLNWCSSTLKIFISSRNGVDMTMLQGTSILSYTITLGHWQLGRNFYDDDSKLYSDMYKVVGEEWPDLPPLHPDFWSDIVRLSEGSYVLPLRHLPYAFLANLPLGSFGRYCRPEYSKIGTLKYPPQLVQHNTFGLSHRILRISTIKHTPNMRDGTETTS